jgi:hypothetical protein
VHYGWILIILCHFYITCKSAVFVLVGNKFVITQINRNLLHNEKAAYIEKLSAPLRARFLELHLKEYNFEEFIEIARRPFRNKYFETKRIIEIHLIIIVIHSRNLSIEQTLQLLNNWTLTKVLQSITSEELLK